MFKKVLKVLSRKVIIVITILIVGGFLIYFGIFSNIVTADVVVVPATSIYLTLKTSPNLSCSGTSCGDISLSASVPFPAGYSSVVGFFQVSSDSGKTWKKLNPTGFSLSKSTLTTSTQIWSGYILTPATYQYKVCLYADKNATSQVGDCSNVVSVVATATTAPTGTITFSKNPAVFGDKVTVTIEATGDKLSSIDDYFVEDKLPPFVSVKDSFPCQNQNHCKESYDMNLPSESTSAKAKVNYTFDVTIYDSIGRSAHITKVLSVVFAKSPVIGVTAPDIVDAGKSFPITVWGDVFPGSDDKMKFVGLDYTGSDGISYWDGFTCQSTANCINTFSLIEKEPGIYFFNASVYSQLFPDKNDFMISNQKILIRVREPKDKLMQELIDKLKEFGVTEKKMADLLTFIDAEPDRDNLIKDLLKTLDNMDPASDPLFLVETYTIAYDAVYANNNLAEPYRGYFQNIILPNIKGGVIGVQYKKLDKDYGGQYNPDSDLLEMEHIYINSLYSRSAIIHELTHAWQDGTMIKTYGDNAWDYELETYSVHFEYQLRGKGAIIPMGNGTYKFSNFHNYDPTVDTGVPFVEYATTFQRAVDNIKVHPSRNDLNNLTITPLPSNKTVTAKSITISKMSNGKALLYLIDRISTLQNLFRSSYAIWWKNKLAVSPGGVIQSIKKYVLDVVSPDDGQYKYFFNGFARRMQ